MSKYIIIGTGPAGVIAAETLRKRDHLADVTLIGDEPEPPYSRMAIPYFLVHNITEQGTYLRKSISHFEDNNIKLLQSHVKQIKVSDNAVILQNNHYVTYDKLLIATGSKPVKAPIEGIELPYIYNCWTLSDARNIIDHVVPGSKVILMGAGFIGCIILEALAKIGADLTVIEMDNRMVPRMMNKKAGNLIKQWCLQKGINVHTSTKVTAIEKGNTNALTIHLDNGGILNADLLISATGVRANIDFLSNSGIKTDQGIVVNQQMQTNISNIYAAGDVAQGLDFSTGNYSLQAIQPTASEHAQIAAKNMLGLKQVIHKGSVNMNVLDTLGLISSSFGLWMGIDGGDYSERHDPIRFKYINLQFQEDVMIGATSLGLTQHIGVLRGLIQGKVKLGSWKNKLIQDPSRIMEAYLANRLILS